MSPYLDAARSAVHTLFEKQSVHWGGNPDGIPSIVVTQLAYKGFRSVGSRVGNSTSTFYCPAQAVEMQPFRLDLRAWPALELLSDVTGDPSYRQRVAAMAEAFCRHGFDPSSGLGYFGEMVEFDVVRVKPSSVGWAGTEIYFKPTDDIPLDRLWIAAPAAMARMIRATYYGMVTRPETMDFNRFCTYGFDESQKKQVTEFNSQHCATAYAGAYLIHWWGCLFARTGDAECFKWAHAMALKWQAAQHPETGLVPAWFGSDRADENWMPPKPYCNHWDSGTGLTFLRAAEVWRGRAEGKKLAEMLEGIGRRLVTGMARYGYNTRERIFPQWINVDGTRANVSWYTFPSQEVRDEAVKREPILGDVFVFYGSEFYSGRRPWFLDAGTFMPCNVALAAQMTGDPWLLNRAEEFAVAVREEAKKLTGEFNEENQWSLPANASYIKMLLLVFETTGKRQYLDWARELADLELEFLGRPFPVGQPEWWRMPFRNAWIEALLLLHRASVRT